MNKTLNILINTLFPSSDFGYNAFYSIPQARLRTFTKNRIKCSYLYCYKDIQNFIHRIKINKEYNIAIELGKIMAKFTPNNIDYICFAPSDILRFYDRGFNLPYLLSCEISKANNIPILDVFIKKKHTKPQSSLDRKSRERYNFIEFNDIFTNTIIGKNILLIDDVVTTGNTILALHNLLINKRIGRVYILSIAS